MFFFKFPQHLILTSYFQFITFQVFFFYKLANTPIRVNKKPEKISFIAGSHDIIAVPANSGKSKDSTSPKDEYVLAFKADKVIISRIRDNEETSPLKPNTYLGVIKQVYFLGKWGQVMISIPEFPKLISATISSKKLVEYKIQTKVKISISAEDIIFFNEPWIRIKQLEED